MSNLKFNFEIEGIQFLYVEIGKRKFKFCISIENMYLNTELIMYDNNNYLSKYILSRSFHASIVKTDLL